MDGFLTKSNNTHVRDCLDPTAVIKTKTKMMMMMMMMIMIMMIMMMMMMMIMMMMIFTSTTRSLDSGFVEFTLSTFDFKFFQFLSTGISCSVLKLN